MSHQVIVFIAILFEVFDHQVSCHLRNLGPIKFDKKWDTLENRIVGGQTASLKKFPWNVIVVNYGSVCGGTILNKKTVLTAAHCFDNNEVMEEMRVFANSRYLFDPKARGYRVWDFKKHKDFNKQQIYSNDIAVLMVHHVFHYSFTVKMALLCNSDVWKNETKAEFIASGWGETEYNGQTSPEGLMMTNLGLISRENCSEMLKTALSPDMFCLYGGGLRDTCQGDSGGAITWKGLVVGIVSHGKGCAETPGVYTDVFYHLNWIRDTVASLYDTFCEVHQNEKALF